jgi:hypothetical protein
MKCSIDSKLDPWATMASIDRSEYSRIRHSPQIVARARPCAPVQNFKRGT